MTARRTCKQHMNGVKCMRLPALWLAEGAVMTLIRVEGIAKQYGGQQVLRDITFSVETGQFAAIIGKNGCGKSTLLSILAGMLLPDQGTVSLGLEASGFQGAPGREIGYVAQGDCLFEELTVWDNLVFWASAADLSRGQLEGNRYISLLGLEDFLYQRVSRLSGGMRRRTAICSALLGDPSCLLLDEPFAGLDMIYRQELSLCLSGLREMGKTLLYTTHSIEELAALSDITLLLGKGTILCRKSTNQLLNGKDAQTNLITLLKGENDDERG